MSEIEVFEAANEWIRHNFEERNKYSKDLLLQVRFPLLSNGALENILRRTSSFHRVKECQELIDSILLNKNYFFNESKITTQIDIVKKLYFLCLLLEGIRMT